jgi:hypothetical protein
MPSAIVAAYAGGPRTIRVIVEGGLPQGSTPEKPEGDNYSDVPPEEAPWAAGFGASGAKRTCGQPSLNRSKMTPSGHRRPVVPISF